MTTLKQRLQTLIGRAIDTLKGQAVIAADGACVVQVEPARAALHGDFASNIALLLGKGAGLPPRDLARNIIARLPPNDLIDKVEIAGPGFINFFLKKSAFQAVVREILDQRQRYGDADLGQGQRVLLEFVSANPTGPLHVGHGRAAAYGAACAGLLQKAGFAVECEYYVNDAGRQMDILAVSIWLRYLAHFWPTLPFPHNGYQGDYIKDIKDSAAKLRIDILIVLYWLYRLSSKPTLPLPFPDNGYQGDYIKDIAATLRKEYGDRFNFNSNEPPKSLVAYWVVRAMQVNTPKMPEEEMDIAINSCIETIGKKDYSLILEKGLESIKTGIEADLETFGVEFDHWFSERSLLADKRVEACIDELEKNNRVYQKDGAKWFRSGEFGDTKDRVLVRENGEPTYFAADIAYHRDKIERGYERLINIWGADHHGYIARVRAALQALGLESEKLEIRLVQFVSLFRGRERLPMSTRSGEFVTLKALQAEIGRDAARFFYVSRKGEQHLDFDLELARARSNDNPVYYIQYAHARICSVFRQVAEKGYDYRAAEVGPQLAALTAAHEIALLRALANYPAVIEKAAGAGEPHQLAHYLLDLANDFHRCYNAGRFLVEDEQSRTARLALAEATGEVIRNGLAILGVSAPESM